MVFTIIKKRLKGRFKSIARSGKEILILCKILKGKRVALSRNQLETRYVFIFSFVSTLEITGGGRELIFSVNQ